MQQLEAFAYWRKLVTKTAKGERLWSLRAPVAARLMSQAPEYVAAGERVDLYAEVALAGKAQVDLSAQYFTAAFTAKNLLAGRSVAQEGEFLHYYAAELARLQPSLAKRCTLYLEADIDETDGKQVAVFVNLAGSVADKLLPAVLAYRGCATLRKPLTQLLEKLQPWCSPWHFGFMESRAERPVRLVLVWQHKLQEVEQALQAIGAPPLPEQGRRLLEKIAELGIFSYMLDLDVLADGSVGDTVGIELLPKNAIWPARQQQLLQTTEYDSLRKLLLREGLADERINGLDDAVFTAAMNAEIYIYSRISHFKLRWQNSRALPAKAYVQLRSVRRQSCINEALGYIKVAEEAEVGKHE